MCSVFLHYMNIAWPQNTVARSIASVPRSTTHDPPPHLGRVIESVDRSHLPRFVEHGLSGREGRTQVWRKLRLTWPLVHETFIHFISMWGFDHLHVSEDLQGLD